ncbi:acetolactate synthase large subunit [Frondihabitans sp. PhB188]|uniref:acetolactate synthase large subunit n=1 Tax=Frondihabitans sp. PhB188 TaxID=2485200 RepID=UPI000F4A33F4|nr:acetolactate synthase large subunit [Frondihabitans sp. PhB188]ROQ41462.1 acetolactate synthase large subunit [Frondihabitans sp. PhB188]
MTPDASPLPTAPARPRQASPEILTGSGAILRSLEKLGVTDVFGLPGGAIIPFYDELMSSTAIRHILVRHEQGAGHAAEGYAAASGRVGVAIATSGPGATNLVTAIADAYMDSVPLLAITGQVFSTLMGTDAFQEADIVGITMPITKHSFLVTKPEDIPATLAAAYQIASTGRPGPVLVDITKDAQQMSAPFVWPETVDLPGYRPITKAHGKQITAAAQLIAESRKPVFYVGGGVIRSGASAELLELVEATGAPVVTTLMARGAFPDSHRQHLGMPGMHGTVPAVLGLQESDLIIALGARFDDRVTGKAELFAPNAKVVHVDIDPAEISKIRLADVPIVGDAREVIIDLTAAYADITGGSQPDLSAWWERLNGLREQFPLGFTEPDDGLLSPQKVIQRIGQLSGPEAVYASGVGQHQMWSAQFIQYERPHAWLNSGGAGTMGYSVPAAMGAKVGQPDRVVWAIDGDGCFQMTNQELATCVINDIPIKVAIINNSSLGMVRQWQTLFYEGRHSFTDLNTGHTGGGTVTRMVPDFVKLADAYGALGIRVTREDEIDAAIQLALATNDRPVVIDFVVSRDAMVWPMVPQGVSNSEIQHARALAPEWDDEAPGTSATDTTRDGDMTGEHA